VGWNVVEAAVALWSGAVAGSAALIAFGLDSFIELFAGLVLVWRLSRQWKHAEEEEEAEGKALRLVGLSFFLLAAYILAQSGATLAGWLPEPRPSTVGIALVVASALVMTVLYFLKMGIAGKLGSRSLRAEAMESLMCDLQDLTLLVGLGLNALWGWWWADPLAALALLPLILKEGWEGVFERGE
jgi:divalent metal cation (Fe/Co/Zn/Cd) transporter